MNTQKKSGTESGTKSINNVDFIGIKGFSVGQGTTNIESLVISDHLRALSVPNLVPEFKII